MRVFISSTYEDLREYRDIANDALRRLGHETFMLESFSASPDRPIDVAQDAIASCDLFVLIIGWRYGYVPSADNPERLSLTELEYETALRFGKPVLTFMLTEPARQSSKALDNLDRIKTFRDRMTRERVVSLVSSPPELRERLTIDVARWTSEQAARAVGGTVELQHLPLLWRLVVDGHASHDLLRHLEPAAFVAAVEKWEAANESNRDASWNERLERVRKSLDVKQSAHQPSELWLAWMRATRPATPSPGGSTRQRMA